MEMILLPRFELIETLKLIGKLRPTMMPGVPTLFNAMLRHPHIRNFDLSSLEFCISGGAALPIEVKRGFEAMSGCALVEGYGLERNLAGGEPAIRIDRPPGKARSACRCPAPRSRIRSLEDPTQEMPQGEPGEICIAGPQVMTGLLEQAGGNRGDASSGASSAPATSATWTRTASSSSSIASRT